jgi:hypothetical protein
VAIVSISRIQIRRGRKNQGTGLPQLASGEFGWAVDTQELFIGNGSVAEGAPFVGNTKILTEKDNIFDLATNYEYKSKNNLIQTGINENSPVLRTLQERLDDIVSVKSFGAFGDGSDQTAELQRAINNLFFNIDLANPSSRAILWIDPGTYRISSTILLPPNVNIRGAGPEKTIIEYTGTASAFQTINNIPLQSGSVGPEHQSRHNHLSGFTVVTTTSSIAFTINECRNSYFGDINIRGPWRSGDSVDLSSIGIKLNNATTPVTCHSNVFERISIEGFAFGVYARGDVYDNSWNECQFLKNAYSVVFGEGATIGSVGQTTGPINNSIRNSIFDDIDKTAFWVVNGKNNTSLNNKYYSVGNDGGSTLNVQFPIIWFDDVNNLSDGDWFQRTQELAFDQQFILNVPYIPEVKTTTTVDLKYTNKLAVGTLLQPQKLFRMPADRPTGYEIEYLYNSRQVNATRQGTLSLVVNPANNQKQLSDSYEFVGDIQWSESIKFTAEMFDENGDGTVDTTAIMVLNSVNNDSADFYYRVKIK